MFSSEDVQERAGRRPGATPADRLPGSAVVARPAPAGVARDQRTGLRPAKAQRRRTAPAGRRARRTGRPAPRTARQVLLTEYKSRSWP